jgi:hypothetical protein
LIEGLVTNPIAFALQNPENEYIHKVVVPDDPHEQKKEQKPKAADVEGCAEDAGLISLISFDRSLVEN